jgi:hypothetical protein
LDAYRYAVQKPNETLENFMYRFNDLAQAAQLDLSQPKIWLDHYLDWCEKLHDPITSQQYISLNFPSKNELAKYVITRESRSVREDFLKATTEKERRKTTPRPHQVYTMTSTDTASIDMTSESSHTTAYSYNYSDISEIETAQVMALKSMGKNTKRKEFCPTCSSEHFLFDGKCYQTIACPLCQILGHPSHACFQRCKFPECNKAVHHHQDKCPRLKLCAEELQAVKDQNQQLLDLLAQHKISLPTPSLKN